MPKLDYVNVFETDKCKEISDLNEWVEDKVGEIYLPNVSGQADAAEEVLLEKKEKHSIREEQIGPLLQIVSGIESECQVAGWDGYGAEPVSRDALAEIKKLLKFLPSYLPIPHIVPEPTGAIGLEWRKGKDMALVLSVKGEGIINYVALLGQETNRYGVEKFTTTIPQFIQRELFPFFVQE